MAQTTRLALFALCLFPIASWAAGPKVAVDIAPLHSIVSQVMGDVGEPALLIPPESSPHGYSLRPSEAEALSEADVVFWVSEDLTPWLSDSLETLADSATKVEMLSLSSTATHGFREGANFEAHHHGEGADGEEAHHEDESSHADDGEHEDEHHHHGEHDPHAWLDPVNAKAWAAEIADVLAAADSDNAPVYQQNAKAFAASMDELIDSLNERAARLDGIRFIVFHDAYQYFERRFDLLAAGAISISDASDPSPARIREIQSVVRELGVTCAFSEPQYNPRMIDTVFEGSEVTTVGVMDPLGAGIDVGKGHYSELLNQLMGSLEQCAG